MATATLPPPQFTPSAPMPRTTSPQPVKWTCEDYYQLHGIRSLEGRKIILIEGELLEMPAPGPLHNAAMILTAGWLATAFPSTQYCIRNQMGLTLGTKTDPLPDLLVVQGSPRQFIAQATTGELLIEVADSSLDYDTGDKASLYAKVGIKDYWVIDVENRQLHVFRDPQPDASKKYGHWYANVAVLNPTDTVAALAAPNSPVSVGELLP